MPTVHHVGWAVHSIAAARPHFEQVLGLEFRSQEDFPDVRVAFFGTGSAMVELLEPLTGESGIQRFLDQRGEGVHHLALRVDDVGAALDQATGRGLKQIDVVPRPGARSTNVGFVDPQRSDGILIQYVAELA